MIIDDNLNKSFFKIDVTSEDIDECSPYNPNFCAIGVAIKRTRSERYAVTTDYIIVEDTKYFCNKWLTLWRHELIKNKYKMKPISIDFNHQQKKASIEPYKPTTFYGWLYKTFKISIFTLGD